MTGHDGTKGTGRQATPRCAGVGRHHGWGHWCVCCRGSDGDRLGGHRGSGQGRLRGPARPDHPAAADVAERRLTGFDPAAATDLTSWTDSLLASLNSIDVALPSTADPAAAVAAAAEPAATGGTIPITVAEGTEPTVQASIDGGGDVPLLVDTGSSGLVIPYTDLDRRTSSTRSGACSSLGFPTGFSESGYSGGVDYIYLSTTTPPSTTATAPSQPRIPPSMWRFSPCPHPCRSPLNFQEFLSDNEVDGILGVGVNDAGPTTTPFAATTVWVSPSTRLTVSWSSVPTRTPVEYSTVGDSDQHGPTSRSTVGLWSEVSTDVDSGGVFGTIPESCFVI